MTAMSSSRRPTQTDVAREAGVSRALVSLVVRGEPHVRPDKRKAVLAAIDKLGYRTHEAAALLAGKRTATVGVLIPDLVNPWFGMMVGAVQRAAARNGFRVLFSPGNSDDGSDDEWERAHSLLSGRAHALILVSPRLTRADLEDLASLAPVCVVGRPVDSDVVHTVQSDGELGGALAARHLVSRGAHSLAYLGPLGAEAEDVARVRADGFCQEAEALGAGVMVRDVPVKTDPATLSALIGTLRAHGVMGIGTHNDQLALAVLTTAEAEGLVGLVGHDNTPLAAFESIALTSVDQCVDDIADHAMQIIGHASVASSSGAAGSNGRAVRSLHRVLTPALAERRT